MHLDVVAQAASKRGELVLRRRPDAALELRVNGVFVMDSEETSTERALARRSLASIPTATGDVLRVLVAGLGLGYTVAEVLADPRVRSVVVVEIEPALVQWHREGLVPTSELGDPRVDIEVGDIRTVVAEMSDGAVDLVLLDVDNGPGFLVYDANAAVYGVAFLRECRRVMTPTGRVAVWSSDTSPGLVASLKTVFGTCTALTLPVRLGSRDTTYHLYLGPGVTE